MLRRRPGLARKLALSSYPGRSQPSSSDLVRQMYYQKVPRTDSELRRTFDGSTNLQTIASALYAADNGALRDLTDLGQDTREMDPHLSGILNKRFTAVAGIDGVLKPATGPGIDPEKAKFYASVVQDQLAYVKNLTQVRRDIMWTLWNGRSVLENHFRTVERPVQTQYGAIRLALKEIGWIHPRRVALGPDRELRLYDGSFQPQGFRPVGVDLRDFPFKFVANTVRLWNEYPEREGLLRPCIHWSFFKRFSAAERMVLLELFAKPWRWVEVLPDAVANPEDYDAADDIIENLPGNQWARFPRGFTAKTWQPPSKIEQHGDIIEMADGQNSKIVLGQTGTTDAAAMGLGSSQSKVMLSEQLMINIADALWLAEVFEDCVTDAIIAVNFGIAEVTHAPSYRLPIALIDPATEQAAIDRALAQGLKIPLTKAYEAARLVQPDKGEPYLVSESAGLDGFGNPLPPKVMVIFPGGDPDEEPGPDDGGGTPPAPATPNPEAPPGAGVPPGSALPPPGGSLPGETPAEPVAAEEGDPLPGDDPAVEAARKLARRMNENKIPRCEHLKSNRCRLCGIERVRDYELGADGTPEWVVAWKAIGDVEAPALPVEPEAEPLGEDPDEEELGGVAVEYAGILAVLSRHDEDVTGQALFVRQAREIGREGLERISRELDAVDARCVIDAVRATAEGRLVPTLDRVPEGVRLARQPASINGTPEKIVDRFGREVAPITEKLGAKLFAATRGLKTAKQIGRALNKAARDLNLDGLERAIDGELLHGQMLGALDHYIERTSNVEISPETFTYWGLLGQEEQARTIHLAAADDEPFRTNKGFADMDETEAVRFFKAKKVMTKEEFELLDAGAKRRAFTIARMASRSLLELAHAELGRMIAAGFDLRDFTKFANERLISAGWVPASASHVQTIARTNVMQAHSVGRLREMSKPDVAKERPYWQIRTVKDSRQRPAHGAVDGFTLRMSDPFWNKAIPPWGFNCRCRLVSISDRQFEKRGLRLSSGSDISGLPDRGFKGGGVRALLSAY